jgi:hypothetical protein
MLVFTSALMYGFAEEAQSARLCPAWLRQHFPIVIAASTGIVANRDNQASCLPERTCYGTRASVDRTGTVTVDDAAAKNAVDALFAQHRLYHADAPIANPSHCDTFQLDESDRSYLTGPRVPHFMTAVTTANKSVFDACVLYTLSDGYRAACAPDSLPLNRI